mgnify:CR=1 FL=1
MEEKVKAFLELATQKKASDIFIIAGRPLSVKIDGKLCTLDGFEERLMPPETDEFIRIIYKLAHDRNIEPMLETGDDDFSMAIPGLSRFRVNTYRQRGSLAAVIRIIAFNLPDPQDLHIPPAVMEAADLTKGMVLITGPAGSGKSTTMACIIDKISSHWKTLWNTCTDMTNALSASERSVRILPIIWFPCVPPCVRARM